jgi:hypothetical protein
MNEFGHPNQFAARAATKLFTVGCGQDSAALALPTVNNFG